MIIIDLIDKIINKGTILWTVIYFDKEGIKRAKVRNSEISIDFEIKKLKLQGLEIVEKKKIDCKSEKFNEKLENEKGNVNKDNLNAIKKEIETEGFE